jgi:protein SCO1/2
MSRGLERRLWWGLLAVAMAAVAVLALAGKLRERRGEALPVLATLPAFELIERDGSTVSLASLAGRPFVADFIFTRCAISCPRMTAEMLRLRGRLSDLAAARRPRLVSISVDPTHDTPAVLADYAREHGVEGADWLFLTGELAPLRQLVRDGFKLAVEDAPPGLAAGNDAGNEMITHSNRFVLVDATGRIRGYYDAFESGELERLLADLAALGD